MTGFSCSFCHLVPFVICVLLRMNHQTGHICDKPSDTNQSQNTFNHSLLNSTSLSCLDHKNLNFDLSQHLNCTVKYIDYHTMLIDQKNAVLDFKMSECGKLLARSLDSNRSLHMDMMNSENNRGNEILDLSQTTNICQENILNISDNIDDSLKQVNMNEIEAKQELEILEHKHYLDIVAWQTTIEELNNKVNILKSENVMLLGKLNETNMMLIKEKEITFNLNSRYFEKELKLKEDQNGFLINQNKSINSKLDEIQSLNNEIIIIKKSLDESIKKLDEQSTKSKEQTELMDRLKTFEVLNETLKKDNVTLKERIECLEKTNTDLMDCNRKKEISVNKIKEEKENEFKKIHENYNDLLKTQEEMLTNITQQLELHREKENRVHSEGLVLRHENEICNNTIVNLQNEVKAKNILIPELQKKIDDLNEDLNKTHKKMNDSWNEVSVKTTRLEEEKIALEQKNQEYIKQIENLTTSNKKYISKAKQLDVEAKRLQGLLGQKKAQLLPMETIEVLSDSEENNIGDSDCSIIECNDQNELVGNVHSSSNRKQLSTLDHSNVKRNSSFVTPVDKSIVKKKRRTVENPTTLQKIDKR